MEKHTEIKGNPALVAALGLNHTFRLRAKGGMLEIRPTDRKDGENLLPKGEKLVRLTIDRTEGRPASVTCLVAPNLVAETKLVKGDRFILTAEKHGWLKSTAVEKGAAIPAEAMAFTVRGEVEVAPPEPKKRGRKPKAETAAAPAAPANLESDIPAGTIIPAVVETTPVAEQVAA